MTTLLLLSELSSFIVGHPESWALAAVDVENPAAAAHQGPERQLPDVVHVGAATGCPPYSPQRGPRVNADFSSTRVALGMARVRYKTRSPVTTKRSKPSLASTAKAC